MGKAKEGLFPEVPEDLSELTDEELAELRETYSARAAQITQEIEDGTGELLTDRDPQAVIEELTEAAEAMERMKVETTAREDAVKNFKETASEKLKSFDVEVDVEVEAKEEAAEEVAGETVDEDKVEEEKTEEVDSGETEEVVEEATVASAEKPRMAMPKPSAERRPTVSKSTGRGFVASAGLARVAPGSDLDRDSLIAAMQSAHDLTIAGPMRQKVIVASAQAEYPDDRRLDGTGDQDKIDKVLQGANRGQPSQALVAAAAENGGSCLCAPVTPYYGQLGVSIADRPVRDALVGFQATRGGIQYVLPPSFADITTAVGIITEEECEADGSSSEKGCQDIDCNEITEVVVAAIYRCLGFKNLAARAAPEVVAAWTDLAIAAQSFAAEQYFLDQITAASIAVTAAGPNGAINSLLGDIVLGAAGMRSRHRMNPDAALRVLLPSWTKDLLVIDLVRAGEDNRFDLKQGGVEALLRSYNVVPTFYLDSDSGGAPNQVFAGQAPGPINNWPADVIWYLFAEGSFLALSSGQLDLGIVRDSTLNAQNKFKIFAETWENVAFVGVESLQVTSKVCASGETALPSPSDLACSGWTNASGPFLPI